MLGTVSMSERVTWEECPRCGGRAAVGWGAEARMIGGPPREEPEEFDCLAGCELGRDELRRAFARTG
jgi:hypothetical protein